MKPNDKKKADRAQRRIEREEQGAIIKSRREAIGLARNALDALAGVGRDTTKRVERGDQVSTSSIKSILDALGRAERVPPFERDASRAHAGNIAKRVNSSGRQLSSDLAAAKPRDRSGTCPHCGKWYEWADIDLTTYATLRRLICPECKQEVGKLL